MSKDTKYYVAKRKDFWCAFTYHPTKENRPTEKRRPFKMCRNLDSLMRSLGRRIERNRRPPSRFHGMPGEG